MLRNRQVLAQLIDCGNFAVSGGQPYDRLNLTCFGMVAKARTDDPVRGNNSFERRFDYFLRRRGNDVQRKLQPFYVTEQLGQKRDIHFESNALADIDKVLMANFSEIGIMQQEVRKFASLLYK